MSGHFVRAITIFAASFASSSRLFATEEGTKCLLSPNATEKSLEIRASPSNSAPLLGTVDPNQAGVRELDIISLGARQTEWIKVRTGEVNGWITAASLECRLSPDEARAEISTETTAVLEALANKNIAALTKYIDPLKGVRFSPSATVAPNANIVLKKPELSHFFTNTQKRIWGSDDATGELIRLTDSGYYSRFIYDRDYRKSPVIGFNTFEAKSTDRNNAWDVYPNAIIVEYYCPPSAPDGNDWASLRLVYEKDKGRWFLTGVIHDAWTI